MRCLVVLALLASVATPVFAQSGDLVMRRPLPNSRGLNEQTDTPAGLAYVYQVACRAGVATPTADCLGVDVAAQSVTPSDQSLCAAFSPTPEQRTLFAPTGLVFQSGLSAAMSSMSCPGTPPEPEVDAPGDEPGDGFTFDPVPGSPVDQVGGDSYNWQIGPWEGDMSCGTRTVLTRDVQCVASAVVDYDWSDESNPQPIYADVQATYEECSGFMSQQPPATGYKGSKAGCGYKSEETSWGPWIMPSGGSGTLTCSRDAYRISVNTCKNASGTAVDDAFCEQGLDPNGGYGPTNRYQFGNYESCAPKWKVRESAPRCDGADLKANVEVTCVRDDGVVLTGAAASCPASDRPQSGERVVGSCVKKADYRRISSGNCGGAVLEQMHGTADHQGLYWPIWTSDDYRAAKQQCIASGASCCAFNADNGTARLFSFEGPYDPDAENYFAYDKGVSVPWESSSPNDLDGSAYAVVETKWVPKDYKESIPYPWVP